MLGGLFPGGPVIFHGTNPYLGWAHTVNYPDKIDVFQLEMHPEKENLYRLDEDWVELEHREVTLKVKLLPGIRIPVKRDAYYSQYGPVVKNDSGYFAFHMAIYDEIRAVEQWYRMNKATDLKSFREALNMVAIPSFNIMYADREDNIFYVSNARLPLRDPEYDWKETLPGNQSATLPKEYHPFSDLPQYHNPEAAYLFNTNNTPFNATAAKENLHIEDFDSTMGFELRENNRSLRFMELMAPIEKLSWEKFKEIKFDVSLPDSLAYEYNVNALFRMDPELAREAAPLVELFQKWNKRGETEDVGAAQFKVFYSFISYNPLIEDKRAVKPTEMIDALLRTQKYFLKYFGRLDVSLGEFQKLVRGKEELPLRGLPDVLAAMWTERYKDGMVKGYSGESYIQLVRFPETGLPIIESIHAYGNSSVPDNPHYTDQMKAFTRQALKPMTLDIDKVREEAVRIYSPGYRP
jgi:acyl-homoserine-lactone acylase